MTLLLVELKVWADLEVMGQVIIWRKKVASKLKKDNPKRISVHCHNYRLAFAILLFFKKKLISYEK